ncbi:MAG: translation elongation factor Ts [Deltaproteobacteria bacterium]|nr:translation elongation factor Ts [Deltaproteobacteria bacterium]
MSVNMDLVKELREKTGAGMLDCKNALEKANGDINKAIELLREKGLAIAQKRSAKVASQGAIGSYIHMNGKIGVLLEINCETDFVAKTEDFQKFMHEIAMQIAAANPKYLRREDVPEEVISKEREIYTKQLEDQKKPPQVIEKIVEGKIEKFFEDVCLLDQPYIRDEKKKVGDLLKELIAKLGENIVIRRFVRFQLGETLK